MKWPTPLEAQVLACVIQEGPIYGLEIVRKTSVKRGSVYVLLGRLETMGFVLSSTDIPDDPEDDYEGIPRRFYWASPLGMKFRSVFEAIL